MTKEKFVEMSPKQFRKTIAEMVKVELARRLLESAEEEQQNDGAEKEEGIEKAKREILDVLNKRLKYVDKTNLKKKDVSQDFLTFIGNYAKDNSIESFMGLSTLEDLAGRIAVNYSTSQNWDKAKEAADRLTTKFFTGSGEARAKNVVSKMVQNRRYENQQEAILQMIDTKLTPIRGSALQRSERKRQNLLDFVAWIRKNHPGLLDPTDDMPTALVKYADFYAQPEIPANKSLRSDLDLFLASSRVGQKIDSVLADAEKSEENEESAASTPAVSGGKKAKRTSVLGTEGEILKDIAKQLGVTEKAIHFILASIPPGKVNAIYSVLTSMLRMGEKENAKRTLNKALDLADRAVDMAAREFLMLIDDAIDLSEGEFSLTDLLMALEEEGLRDGLTDAEKSDEDVALLQLVNMVNNPAYADGDLWKQVVEEVLKQDLLSGGIKVQTSDGTFKSQNAIKSFQNLVARAIGIVDPASWKKAGAGAPSAEDKRRLAARDVAAQNLPIKTSIGQLGTDET